MVSTTASEIDTLRNFLRSPESIDITELANALGIINISIEGNLFISFFFNSFFTSQFNQFLQKDRTENK
jgi:hypothetical protein